MTDRRCRPSIPVLVAVPIVVLFHLVSVSADAEQGMFTDMTEQIGLDFVHWNGMSGELYMVEQAAGGLALFDFDRDGDLDLFLTQGHLLDTEKTLADVGRSSSKEQLRDRLYRNEWVPAPGSGEGGRLRFVDVTSASGIDSRGYGQGATVGDFDNDGWPDLYINNFGPNQLWRNKGDGTFEDVTDETGTGDARWTVSSAFVDLDGDTWLDLYIGNYLDLSLKHHEPCFAANGQADYCGPTSYEPQVDRLLRNRGGQKFEDLTASVGVGADKGPALGMVSGDFDADGRLDLYVANDETPNFLWMSRGKPGAASKLENEALLGGCAVNAEGLAESSMGLDAGDVDGDGDEDLFMAHLGQQTNTLYINDGTGFFDDVSEASGLGLPSWPYTGFGAKLMDIDNDGWLDVLVVNGAVKTIEALARAGDPFPLGQPDMVFMGQGPDAEGIPRFVDATARGGSALAGTTVSRGMAVGDLDNDGDADAVVFDNNGPPRVLINRVGNANSWIGLEPWDPELGREAIGARVGARAPGVLGEGRPMIWRRMRREGSYAAANDPRILVGLGSFAAAKIGKVIVEWPDGSVEHFGDLAVGAYHRLEKGKGTKPSAATGSEDSGGSP